MPTPRRAASYIVARLRGVPRGAQYAPTAPAGVGRIGRGNTTSWAVRDADRTRAASRGERAAAAPPRAAPISAGFASGDLLNLAASTALARDALSASWGTRGRDRSRRRRENATGACSYFRRSSFPPESPGDVACATSRRGGCVTERPPRPRPRTPSPRVLFIILFFFLGRRRSTRPSRRPRRRRSRTKTRMNETGVPGGGLLRLASTGTTTSPKAGTPQRRRETRPRGRRTPPGPPAEGGRRG